MVTQKKTWLITGVSTRFGRELALARGDRVAGTVRQEAQRSEFDALAQTIPYVGFAVIAKGLGAAIEVFRERGIELSAKTAKETGVS